MAFGYNWAKASYGDTFQSAYNRKDFRRLRQSAGVVGMKNELNQRYGIPGQGQPQQQGTGPLPNTTNFNPFESFANGAKVNMPNFMTMASDFYNNSMGNQSLYRDQMNKMFTDIRGSAPYGAMRDPALVQKLLSPVLSEGQITQNVARGQDKTAMEGSAIEDSIRAALAGSGQRADAAVPALAGAKYMTAYRSGQNESDYRTQAANTNRQGLLQGTQQVSGMLQQMLGVNEQEFNALKEMMGGDERFFTTMLTIFGGKLAKAPVG